MLQEVIVTSASNKFDAEGNLLDENTKKFLTQISAIHIPYAVR